MSHSDQLTELEYKRLQKNANNVKQTWEELDNIYRSIAESIVTVLEQVNSVVGAINKLGVTSHPEELVVAINGIRVDSESFTKDLLKIKKRHEGRSGVINDEDELALCLSIFSDYTELNDRFKNIIFNPMLVVTEAVTDISQKIKESKTA